MVRIANSLSHALDQHLRLQAKPKGDERSRGHDLLGQPDEPIPIDEVRSPLDGLPWCTALPTQLRDEATQDRRGGVPRVRDGGVEELVWTEASSFLAPKTVERKGKSYVTGQPVERNG